MKTYTNNTTITNTTTNSTTNIMKFFICVCFTGKSMKNLCNIFSFSLYKNRLCNGNHESL